MKLKNILCVLIVFILFSCKKNKDEQLKKDILGEWTYIKTEDQRKPKKSNNSHTPPPPTILGNHVQGYIFSENNLCEDC